MKGVVLGGTQSGVGKTVATLSALRALSTAGYAVQPAKAGPDFIDPSHHRVVADRPSRTLDVWLQGEAGTERNYWRGTGDICLVEGMMGLYDGSVSSTAMVAETLDLPVVLVVDASAGMESVGATALGFRAYADRIGRDVDVAGVLVQQAHGGRHERGVRDALPDGMTYCGRVPPDDRLGVPERHLGLHMGEEAPIPDEALAAAAAEIRTERLVDIAREPPGTRASDTADPAGHTVAVADDEAFCFRYPGTTERLRELGSVEPFSPVAGDPLPACDAVYLPGGYPELHAETLAASRTLDDLAARGQDGLPILGECGGYMALAESLATGERTVELTGLLPASVEMRDRYQALDHVALVGTEHAPGSLTGERVPGHEFHYSRASVGRDARYAFTVERGQGIDGDHDGVTEYATVGTYAHGHAESGLFDGWLDAVEG